MQAPPQIPQPSGKVDTVSFSPLMLSLSWHGEISSALFYKQDNTGSLCLHVLKISYVFVTDPEVTKHFPRENRVICEVFLWFKTMRFVPLNPPPQCCSCVFWNMYHRKMNRLGLGENSDPSRVPSKALGLSASSQGMEWIAGPAGLH